MNTEERALPLGFQWIDIETKAHHKHSLSKYSLGDVVICSKPRIGKDGITWRVSVLCLNKTIWEVDCADLKESWDSLKDNLFLNL